MFLLAPLLISQNHGSPPGCNVCSRQSGDMEGSPTPRRFVNPFKFWDANRAAAGAALKVDGGTEAGGWGPGQAVRAPQCAAAPSRRSETIVGGPAL